MESIFIVGIVFFTIYKIIEIGALQKNRKHLIDRMIQFSPETFQSNINSLNSTLSEKTKNNRFASLRWGTLALGVGLGWILGEILYVSARNNVGYSMNHDSVLISSTAICTGIALIVVYFVERKALNESKNE